MHPRRLTRITSSALLLPLLAGCDGDVASTLEAMEVIAVTPDRLALAVGDSAVVRASTMDRQGRALRRQYVFLNGPSTVTAVRITSDSTAIVRAVGAGIGTVAVTSDRGQTVTLPVTVQAR